MIDFHCHLLPNLDDGPADIDESVTMAKALQKAGFRTIYCTPHLIKGSFEADNKAVTSSVSILQKRLNADNLDLEILPGREYFLDEFLNEYLKDPLFLGKTKYIMIEIPNDAPVEYIKETCFRIKCGGSIPMIAHPERCNLFAMPQRDKSSGFHFANERNKIIDLKQEEPALLDYLKDIGCAFQGNFGSFDGWYGSEVQNTANDLKKKEVFTHFGTDVHSLAGIKYLERSVKSER